MITYNQTLCKRTNIKVLNLSQLIIRSGQRSKAYSRQMNRKFHSFPSMNLIIFSFHRFRINNNLVTNYRRETVVPIRSRKKRKDAKKRPPVHWRTFRRTCCVAFFKYLQVFLYVFGSHFYILSHVFSLVS